MIYTENTDLLIRDMEAKDPAVFAAEERRQGWHATEEKYENRLRDAQNGKCVSLTAVYQGAPAGYVNVYFDSPCGAFGGRGLCEIVDFGVLKKYRRRGVGGQLMDAAEAIAKTRSDTVYLGVGLHSGYGAAQRMYVKRGYIPDGTGAWMDESVAKPYQRYELGDDLVLYLSKQLYEVRRVTGDKRAYLDLLLLADEQEDMIDRYLDAGDMYVLDDGGVLAECVVMRLEKGVYELKNIAVRPEHQRRGYGKRLIDAVISRYPDCDTMYVGTGDCPSSLTFYHKCGFTESHRVKNFFTDNYDHAMFEDGVQLVDMVYLKRCRA